MENQNHWWNLLLLFYAFKGSIPTKYGLVDFGHLFIFRFLSSYHSWQYKLQDYHGRHNQPTRYK